MTITSYSKCVLCPTRATREYKGKPYCAIHYTILMKNPPAPVSMSIPDIYARGERNW